MYIYIKTANERFVSLKKKECFLCCSLRTIAVLKLNLNNTAYKTQNAFCCYYRHILKMFSLRSHYDKKGGIYTSYL